MSGAAQGAAHVRRERLVQHVVVQSEILEGGLEPVPQTKHQVGHRRAANPLQSVVAAALVSGRAGELGEIGGGSGLGGRIHDALGENLVLIDRGAALGDLTGLRQGAIHQLLGCRAEAEGVVHGGRGTHRNFLA